MRIIVRGDIRKSPKPLLDTNQATALLIATDDGQPNVIFHMLNDKTWARYTKGEDKNFNEMAKNLGLIK